MNELPCELIANVASRLSASDVLRLVQSNRCIRSKIESNLSRIYRGIWTRVFDTEPTLESLSITLEGPSSVAAIGAETETSNDPHPWRALSPVFRRFHDRYALRKAILTDIESLSPVQIAILVEIVAETACGSRNVEFLFNPARTASGSSMVDVAVETAVWCSQNGQNFLDTVGEGTAGREVRAAKEPTLRERFLMSWGPTLGASLGILALLYVSIGGIYVCPPRVIMEVDFSFLEFVKRGRATLPVVRLFAASAAALRVVHLRRMNTVSKASPNTSPFGTWLQHMMGHTGPQREDQSESFALPMTRIVSEEFSGVALRTLRDAIATVRDYSEEVGPSVAIILSKDLRLLALFQHAVTSNRTTATQIERFLTLHIYDFILALPMCILGTWQGFYQYRAFTETEMDPMMTFSIRSCEKWNVPHPDAVQSYLIRGGGEDGVGPYTMVGDVASGGTVRVEKRYRRHMWLYEGVILPCGIAGVWGSPGGAAQGTFVWWKGCEQDSRSMSVNV